jgi:hypothetical protein
MDLTPNTKDQEHRMSDSTTPQDDAAMSPASTGSVANDPLSVCCRHLANSQHIIEEKNAEIYRLRLTDAEREAVAYFAWGGTDKPLRSTPLPELRHRDSLRRLLNRTK